MPPRAGEKTYMGRQGREWYNGEKALKGGLGHMTNATPGVCILWGTMEGLYVGE